MSEVEASSPHVAVVLNRDLMFGSRVRSALKALGMEARVVPNGDQFVEALREDPAAVAIAIIDMNGEVDWPVIGQALRGDEGAIPTIAFGSHMDVDNLRAAKASGATRVVSNGQFHREMTALIERYRRPRA